MPMDWAASAIKPGRQSLHRTSMDRLPRVAKFQTGKGAGRDVTESVNAHTW